MSLIKLWSPYFSSNVRLRGREYYTRGQVTLVLPENGEVIRANVQGSRAYSVTISGEGTNSTCTCTCAFFLAGEYCKHIWATILQVHFHGSVPASAAMADAIVVPNESGFKETPVDSGDDDGGVALPPPRARKRTGAARPAPVNEAEWIGRLSLLRTSVNSMHRETEPLEDSVRRICYVIRPDSSHDSLKGLHVCPMEQRAVRKGWSKPKLLRLQTGSLTELQDESDRELCGFLAAHLLRRPYGPITIKDYATYDEGFALPPGVVRSLLKKIVLTGRAYFSLDREIVGPLEWDGDEPWTLWAIARSEENELVMDMELRCGERKMTVHQPAVLAAGPEGVLIHGNRAGLFDDRGASGWLSHFRRAYPFDSKPDKALRIPMKDVDQFLGQLYRLPRLPEIDLPSTVRPVERRVPMLPSIEFHSPGSKIQGFTLVSKEGTVNASVSFVYGEVSVAPGVMGQFIGATNEENAADDAAAEEEESQDVTHKVPDDDDDDDDNDEPKSPIDSIPTPRLTRVGLIRRDLRAEESRLDQLLKIGMRRSYQGLPAMYSLSAKDVPDIVRDLLINGWRVAADQKAFRSAGVPRVSIASGVDWFDLEGTFTYETENGPQDVALPDLLAAIKSGKRMITLGDGSQGLLPEEWLAQHGLLTAVAKVEGTKLRFKFTQAALIDSLLDRQSLVHVDARFEEIRTRLRSFEKIDPIQPASSFTGTLRTYQQEGLGWLAFLRDFGMGGILADDMGLGKTIQVLAMLDSHYKDRHVAPASETPANAESESGEEPKRKHLPSIIIVPRSVVYNWIDEASKFAPNLRVQAYTGTDRVALREAFEHHDVIITTYGLMRRDVVALSKTPFDYIVLDEAQAIKNPASQSAKAARLLEAHYRLALTGTPVENHLGDLWSIFEFLNPGFLGSNTTFGRLLADARSQSFAMNDDDEEAVESETKTAAPPVAAISVPAIVGDEAAPTAGAETAEAGEPDEDGVSIVLPEAKVAPGTGGMSALEARVASALRPFILRRTKKQVLKELPEKTEQTIYCELEGEQRRLYDELRDHYRQLLLKGTGRATDRVFGGKPAGKTAGKAAPSMPIVVLEALLRLRQAACHPGLIDDKRRTEPAAKMEVLLERISDLIDEGHKTLVFSQFTSLLSIVREQLDNRGLTYEYLDGQTVNRRERVERFQTDPKCPIFLISLKAGGLGLNLTAAEYVFILDPWWNPAVEAQAIDRSHRIGQTRHVFAYRLICKNTVEEKIAELQAKKRDLAQAIIGGEENVLRTLTREDLEMLLS